MPEYWNMKALPPSAKLRCFVQIYIIPVPCTTTPSNLEKDYSNYVTPNPYFLNTIFDSRLNPKALEYADVTKYYTFAIQVEVAKPDSVFWSTSKTSSMYHYMELLHRIQSIGIMYSYYYQIPSKLNFWIEYSKESESFMVVRKAIRSCTDYQSHFQNVAYKCKGHFGNKQTFGNCEVFLSTRIT